MDVNHPLEALKMNAFIEHQSQILCQPLCYTLRLKR